MNNSKDINSKTNNKKIKFGQFFTKKEVWLKPQVIDFIKQSNCKIAYDPFAGAGDLLNVAKTLGFKKTVGLDIDTNLKWKINNSLISIPHIDNAIIITNPPYLAKQSATRKHLDLSQYFDNTSYTDVYLIALEKMLDSQKCVVAIIPESFINSNFLRKDLLYSITILEENPFDDTENPVCVVCFDNIHKKLNEVKIYKNDTYINNLEEINKIRINPINDITIRFNDLDGWLGLRAIDSTNDKTFIKFDFKTNFKYDWNKRIKVSSRHLTLINIEIQQNKRQIFVDKANDLVYSIREKSKDILLTPFKGNTKQGIRRRRLDFRLARAILETAYNEIYDIKKQPLLFSI